MVYYTLQCDECDKNLVGRDTSNGIQPVQDACPDCGATAFTVLADED